MEEFNFKFKSRNLEIFDKLYDNVREFIIFSIEKDPLIFFYISGLDESILKLTPIEQLFWVANDLYSSNILRYKEGVQQLQPQKNLSLNGKKYIVDFYIGSYFSGNKEYKLKNPIIIELDGFDYHSSKNQMNYDYKRENELKLSGYNVIRFTGSQVYNEPFKCIETVCDFINQIKTQKGE